MNGSKFLQVLTLLLCAGMLYFSYETYKEAKQMHQESQAMLAKADSLLTISVTKTAAKSGAKSSTKSTSFLDEIISDLEKDYRASKKESAKSASNIRVSSSYRLEDRYVIFGVDTPDYVGNETGTIIIDIIVDKSGDVKKTSVNPASTIADEEVVEAARKAALKTGFNYNSDAPDMQSGTITYTYAKK